jgi:hypothetical protein
VPEYKVTVSGTAGSWRRYESDEPLEYGDEIVVERESDEAPTTLRARVISVDNDALFTSKVEVEPINDN